MSPLLAFYVFLALPLYLLTIIEVGSKKIVKTKQQTLPIITSHASQSVSAFLHCCQTF